MAARPRRKLHVSSDDELAPPPRPSGLVVDLKDFKTYENQAQIPFVPTGRALGNGGYGSVVEVTRKVGGAIYAHKELQLSGSFEHQLSKALHEVRAMKILRGHRHMIDYVDSYRFENSFIIISGPVAAYTLQCVLDPHPHQDFDQEWRRNILRKAPGCLVTAFAFLERHGMIHGDISGNNILVHNSAVILIDFGMSVDINTSEKRLLQCGIERPSSCADDVWHLGLYFIDIATALHGIPVAEFRDSLKLIGFEWDSPLLRWIWYLWAIYNNTPEGREIAMATSELEFLMLDANSKTRITALQMVKLVAQRYAVVRNSCCNGCRQEWNMNTEGMPFATFKEDRFADLKKGAYPENALRHDVPKEYWLAQRKWLEDFIHWPAEEKEEKEKDHGKEEGADKTTGRGAGESLKQ